MSFFLAHRNLNSNVQMLLMMSSWFRHQSLHSDITASDDHIGKKLKIVTNEFDVNRSFVLKLLCMKISYFEEII